MRLLSFKTFYNLGVPITFLLGFYVSLVVKRWWEQYCKLPWPDTIAIYLKGLVVGNGQVEKKVEARMIRRTVIRYCILAYILCIRQLSSRLRKRFPNMEELLKTGLVRSDELLRLGDEETNNIFLSNWWIPLKWAIEILNKAKEDGLVPNVPGYSHLLGRITHFRQSLSEVATYVYLPVPLVYTQVRVRVRSLQSVHLYTISDTHDSRKSFSGEGGRSSRTAPNCLTRILLRVS